MQYGFNTLNRVTGSVSRVGADGETSKIWPQPSDGDSSGIVYSYKSEEETVFQLSNDGRKSITQSGSFEVGAEQTLIITNTSSIKGGTVDLFLFSPSGKEQCFTIGGGAGMSKYGEITLPLSSGIWAYNCTGFFDSGDITITGKVSGTMQGKSAAADRAAYEVMQYSKSWAMVEYMLPYMTKQGIDAAVNLNNELNSGSRKTASDYYGLATPSKIESDEISYTLMSKSGNWTYSSPLFPYMTNNGIDKVIALYNHPARYINSRKRIIDIFLINT